MHETLRITSILLQPYIPDKAGETLDVMGVLPSERSWGDAKELGTIRNVSGAVEKYTGVGYRELWPMLK